MYDTVCRSVRLEASRTANDFFFRLGDSVRPLRDNAMLVRLETHCIFASCCAPTSQIIIAMELRKHFAAHPEFVPGIRADHDTIRANRASKQSAALLYCTVLSCSGSCTAQYLFLSSRFPLHANRKLLQGVHPVVYTVSSLYHRMCQLLFTASQ